MTVKIPSIPGPPPGLEPGLRNWCILVQESLGVRFDGRAGPLDQAVTRRELVDGIDGVVGFDSSGFVTAGDIYRPYAYGRFDGTSGATNPTVIADSGVTSVVRNAMGHWTITFDESPGNYLFMSAIVGGYAANEAIIQWVPTTNATLDIYCTRGTGAAQDGVIYFSVFNNQP